MIGKAFESMDIEGLDLTNRKATKLFSTSGAILSYVFVAFFHLRGLDDCAWVLAWVWSLPLTLCTLWVLFNRPHANLVFFTYMFTAAGVYRLWCEPSYLPDLFFVPFEIFSCFLCMRPKQARGLSIYGMSAILLGILLRRFGAPPVAVVFFTKDTGPTFSLVFAGTSFLMALTFAAYYAREVRMAASLRERTEELTDLADDYRNLVAVLTHDFSNNVMVAALAAEKLRHQLSAWGVDGASSMERIDGAVQNIHDMIRKLRELRAVCGIGGPGDPTDEVLLGKVIDRARFLFGEKIQQRGVQFDFEDELPPGVALLTDPAVFSTHIFNNLLDNAVKFSPDGSRISVRAVLRENRACLSITNEVRMDALSTSADPKKSEGLGLGLQIVQRFCQKRGIAFTHGFQNISGKPYYVTRLEVRTAAVPAPVAAAWNHSSERSSTFCTMK